MTVPGGGDYSDYLVPGMLALTMAFGLEATMLAITQDLNKGVIDRFRSLPMASSAVLVGRSVAGHAPVRARACCSSSGSGSRWAGAGTAAPATPWPRSGCCSGCASRCCGSASIWAWSPGGPKCVQAVQILVWPVGFLSNVFAAPESMPDWLGAVAAWNPMSATATAVRDLFGSPGGGGASWAADHAGLLAVCWPLALLAVFFPLAVGRYRGLSR